jgi:transposase
VSDGKQVLARSKTGRKKTRWTRAFKLRAMALMDAAEDVTALAAELGVQRELLYRWRRKYLAQGPDALQQIGRPVFVPAATLEPPAIPRSEDAAVAAQRRIAELERKVGQQQLDLDFFRAALRHVRAPRRSNGGSGETGSTR